MTIRTRIQKLFRSRKTEFRANLCGLLGSEILLPGVKRLILLTLTGQPSGSDPSPTPKTDSFQYGSYTGVDSNPALLFSFQRRIQKPDEGPEPTFPSQLVKAHFGKFHPLSKETETSFNKSFMNFKTISYGFPQLQSFLRK